MGRAQRTSAAGNEASGVAADEAGKPIVAGVVFRDEMVVHSWDDVEPPTCRRPRGRHATARACGPRRMMSRRNAQRAAPVLMLGVADDQQLVRLE
jgi:hypothetical protein